MPSGGSIHALVDAEQEAKKVIQRAKDRRSEISAAAKADTRREIAEYAAAQDAWLVAEKKRIETASHDQDDEGAVRSKDEISSIQIAKDRNIDIVVQSLLRKVLTVEIPQGSGDYSTLFDGTGMA
eukprot:Hpha_TRINITY_DN27665_c0_g1::TRINITY_DN27665_c0_g1_i1::g.57408::m.57408/K02152/ATPeV1G, ATP6G; V-type H+-transporting ATPase subunit G